MEPNPAWPSFAQILPMHVTCPVGHSKPQITSFSFFIKRKPTQVSVFVEVEVRGKICREKSTGPLSGEKKITPFFS